MGVSRFEDLRVWQEARALSDDVGSVLGGALQRDPPLRDQLNRAVVSTVGNIAEGFARASRREFRQFVKVALGSNAEARACLILARGRHHLSDADAMRLMNRTDVIGRMLRKLLIRLEE